MILAARPSMGKTSLALNMAEHVAVTLQKPVALFSLEMSKAEIAQRLLCSVGKVDQQRLKRASSRRATGRASRARWRCSAARRSTSTTRAR